MKKIPDWLDALLFFTIVGCLIATVTVGIRSCGDSAPENVKWLDWEYNHQEGPGATIEESQGYDNLEDWNDVRRGSLDEPGYTLEDIDGYSTGGKRYTPEDLAMISDEDLAWIFATGLNTPITQRITGEKD